MKYTYFVKYVIIFILFINYTLLSLQKCNIIPLLYYRKAMEKEKQLRSSDQMVNGNVMSDICDPVVTKLDLCCDSEDEDVSVPEVRTSALSPEHSNNVSNISTASSTETIPTAREVIQSQMELVEKKPLPQLSKSIFPHLRDSGGPIISSRVPNNLFDFGQPEMSFRNESNFSDGTDVQSNENSPVREVSSDIEADDSKIDLNSTAELLSAKIGGVNLDSSSNDSVISDQVDNGMSSPGNAADVSSDCQSSDVMTAETSCIKGETDGEVSRSEPDYIPMCEPMKLDSSTSSEECSREDERPQTRDMLSPLPRFSLAKNSNPQGSFTSDCDPEDSSSYHGYSVYTTFELSDSKNSEIDTNNSCNQTGEYSPVKRIGAQTIPQQKQHTKSPKSSAFNSYSSTMNFPEGSFCGECRHRDGSGLGNYKILLLTHSYIKKKCI